MLCRVCANPTRDLHVCSRTLRGSMIQGNDMTQQEVHEDSRASRSLTSRLRHVYWIGGASGAGKSTIARRLADKHGLRLYSTDEAMGDHAHRWLPQDCPKLTEFVKMSMDQRWVDRSPQTMLETFHWFQGEGFGLIIEDLLALPPDQGVIAEGFRLLPHLVKPLLHIRAIASGSSRRPSSDWRRSKAAAPCGVSPTRPATRNAPCATCWNAIGFSPSVSSAWSRRPVCPPSRSTAT
jgi:hypothetical protein